MKPELRQFGSLTAEDFERIPVWLACHVADYDESWYDETDEETFRPWAGEIPVSAADGMYLVKAVAGLADGSSLPAFLTPDAGNELSLVQPQVFVAGKLFSFWGGMFGIPPERRDAFYKALGKSAEAVFPIRFVPFPGLVKERTEIQVDGFCRLGKHDAVVVER